MLIPAEQRYDIIIAGAGLAGLTLAMELQQHDYFSNMSVLVIDRDAKNKNDRTWCFWAKPEELLPDVSCHRWAKGRFYTENLEKTLDLANYQYHMIRSKDFYEKAHQVLGEAANIQWLQADIISLQAGQVVTSKGTFGARHIFNSAVIPMAILPELGGTPFAMPFSQTGAGRASEQGVALLQHFKGWEIETQIPVFDPDTITLMDFRADQHGETRFVYVLPFSTHRALVEFTVFSSKLLPQEEYQKELHAYITKRLKIESYSIREEEFGVIPMTDVNLNRFGPQGVIPIGTAAGFAKASSGYAFLRTQRKIRALVRHWVAEGQPDATVMASPYRFRVYDSVLLRVLQDGQLGGAQIFERLFKKLPTPLVLRFLDEDSTFAEEFSVMSSMPSLPFLTAVIRQMSAYAHL